MNAQSRQMFPPLLLALVLLCATVGALTSASPLAGGSVLLAIALVFVVSRVDRPLLFLFFAFLIVQDPFLFFVGGADTPSGFIIKRLDEAFLYPFAIWTLAFNRRAQSALLVPRITLLIGGCFAGMVISTAIVGVKWAPALMDLVLFSKPFMLFAIGTGVSADERDIREGLRTGLPCMMFVVLFAVVFLVAPQLQDAYLGSLRVADQRIGMLSAQGFFDGPGVYSWFCAATFAVAYAAYVSFGRIAYLHSAIAAGAFAVLSWRRKSIGGIVAMVIIATAIQVGRDRGSRRRALAVFAIASLVGVTILAPVMTALWQFTLYEYQGDPGSIARLALHFTALEIARDHFPFGTGLASFGSYASAVYYSGVYTDYGLASVWGLSPNYPAFITDTFWPMVLGQGGVASFVPYLLFLVLLLKTNWSVARQTTCSREDRFLALTALFLVVGSLFESTSSHIYDTTMQSALVMVPAGTAWSRFAQWARTDSHSRLS